MIILYILLSHKCRIDDQDEYGATALYKAVDNDELSIVKTLLGYGANPNVRVRAAVDGPDDVTPLHVACQSRQLLQLLLGYGADASAKDSGGQTPADWVALDESRKFDLVKTPNGWRVQTRARSPEKRAGIAGGGRESRRD